MYDTILVTLDTTESDRTIIDHVIRLAVLTHSHVALLHVADGWAARRFGVDAVSPEVTKDRIYLEHIRAEFTDAGIPCEATLAFGSPADEIIRYVEGHDCDLIAMATHGHQFVADLILGETAVRVQHHVTVPVLLVRAVST